MSARLTEQQYAEILNSRTVRRRASKCVVCSSAFYASPSQMERGGGLFCSRKCRGLADRKRAPVDCQACGVTFELIPFRAKTRKLCCDCAKRRPRQACPVCGSAVETLGRKYCSQACYFTAQKQHFKSIPKAERLTNQKCANCNVDFGAVKYDVKRGMGLYCSKQCYYAVRSVRYQEQMHTRALGGKRADLGGLYVRSRWEANYARYLNWLISRGAIRTWKYEPDTFEFARIKRGNRFYTPDFKVFNNDESYEYHEVKGYMDASSKTKLDRMRRFFPREKIVVIDRGPYREIADKVSRLIPTWESTAKKGRY